jgi:hypothetical protein
MKDNLSIKSSLFYLKVFLRRYFDIKLKEIGERENKLQLNSVSNFVWNNQKEQEKKSK